LDSRLFGPGLSEGRVLGSQPSVELRMCRD